MICLGAPEHFAGEQLSYQKFFDSLPYVLPCAKCKEHMLQHLEKNPMDAALAGGQTTLFAWSVQLHNAVNRSLGKPEMTVSDARKHWTSVLEGGKKGESSAYMEKGKQCHKHYKVLKHVVGFLILLISGIILGLIMSMYIR
jgi:hypothetical protein